MNADQLRKARSYIDWMRKNSTLSLYGYFDKDDYGCKPSIGLADWSPLHPKNASRIRKELDKANLPPPSSREARKLPDLKSDNPSFAAMLIKYVNERFGGDAPKVYAAAKISRKTYSAIVGNELRPVSKQTAIQFALALKLSRTEADTFLQAAGFAFSPAILEDIIVCACMSANVFDIDDVNSLLTSYGAKAFPSQSDTIECLHAGDI
ncbi:MAG: hypothetical protein II840_03330 [Kiritimatiellae bacterium]|nr:hypothetical protein [Kiritimatiellia bacterium]